jgi:hypothetical protein
MQPLYSRPQSTQEISAPRLGLTAACVKYRNSVDPGLRTLSPAFTELARDLVARPTT